MIFLLQDRSTGVYPKAFVSLSLLLILCSELDASRKGVLYLSLIFPGRPPGFVQCPTPGPLDLFMVAMALLVGVPLLRLWWYHVQTILWKGQTTNEDMRGNLSAFFLFFFKGGERMLKRSS